jgi:hydroxypyruvate isomerase
MSTPNEARTATSRRGFLAGGATLAAGTIATARRSSATETPACKKTAAADVPGEDYRIANGRINHSVMAWCYNPMPTRTLIEACRKMGMTAMEGCGHDAYPTVKAAGMKVSLTSSHSFKHGPTDVDNHAMCLEKLRTGINAAVEFGAPGVITFTGMRVKGLTDKQMFDNCVSFWKQIVGYAEEKGVNLVFEHLNTRDDTHPMKGHPGYFGDDVDLCIDMIKKVGSPRMKLLFDIYHVQVMNGDVIRRIGQYKDYIGHYHTAGVPGRAEIDETQELNYPAIMRAILETGFNGYVAHEFIPAWDDKLAALRHGVRVCDV